MTFRMIGYRASQLRLESLQELYYVQLQVRVALRYCYNYYINLPMFFGYDGFCPGTFFILGPGVA